jgi:hypothetical protein
MFMWVVKKRGMAGIAIPQFKIGNTIPGCPGMPLLEEVF